MDLYRRLASMRSDGSITCLRETLRKGSLFLLSVLLFVLAIELLKNGTQGVAPLLENHLEADNPVNTLGIGRLFSYLLMSGSPVAVVKGYIATLGNCC